MLIEAAGGRVLIHPSPAENLKVTTPLDLRLAELLLLARPERLGTLSSRTQTSAAAKQTWPTPRATPRLTAPSAAGDRGAGGEGNEHDRELADHRRGAPLPAVGRQAGTARASSPRWRRRRRS